MQSQNPFLLGSLPTKSSHNILTSKSIWLPSHSPHQGLSASHNTGGNFGRTIELDLENGNLRVKTIGQGEKTI